MMKRSLSLPVLLFAAACAGGPPGPPSLQYGDHAVSALTYEHADTTEVSVSMMGQSLAIGQSGAAVFDVALSDAADGVNVLLTVRSLDATISQPMGAPMRVDEGSVSGNLAFSMDRRGKSSVTAVPDVAVEASQLVSAHSLAHSLFPGLPGRGVMPGDSWVDTVQYSAAEAGSDRSELSVTTYTVEGPVMVGEREFLRIGFTGTTTLETDFDMSGMSITQESDLDFEGHVLWDLRDGVMFEHVRQASGSGTVSVPVVPQALPIEITSTQRTRLGG